MSNPAAVTSAGSVSYVGKLSPTGGSRTAPSHPSPPDTPPGDPLLGPVAGLFDRLRDTIGHRGTDS